MENPTHIGNVDTDESSPADKPRKTEVNLGNFSGETGNHVRGRGDDNETTQKVSIRDEGLGPQAKLRVVMWFTLLIVMMTFGALISAYVVLAINRELEWRPFELPGPVWFSTLILVVSSFTFSAATRNLAAVKENSAHHWFAITAALGGIFVASQLAAWLVLSERGVYLSSNPYAALFYVLTAVHGVHVLGGICAVGYLVLKTRARAQTAAELSNRQNAAVVLGWYWHFMDALWIVLFLLLGFWR